MFETHGTEVGGQDLQVVWVLPIVYQSDTRKRSTHKFSGFSKHLVALHQAPQ